MKFLFKKAFLSLLLGLLVSAFSSANTKGQNQVGQRTGINQVKVSQKGEQFQKKNTDKLSHSLPDEMKEKEEWKARGVIIKFHHWPNAKQQKEIIRRLKASGLKKTKSMRSFKTQLFEWSGGSLKFSRFGERACKKVEGLSSVKRCNPDHLLPLNHQPNKVFSNETKPYRVFNDSSFSFLLVEAAQNTEAGFIEHCASCRKQNFISPVPLNIRTCNLLSCQKKSRREISCNHLMKGTLSDYWAQELIGADLLREELKNTPPPERSNWIAVFDSKTSGHNRYVSNLISNEGPHAVLPELENEKNLSFKLIKGMNIKVHSLYLKLAFPEII